MTIGPEPIRQIDSRSRRLGIRHLLHPPVEERPGVMWPRACLRVELHGACALAPEVEALDRAVVERDVCRLARLRRCDREAVVLRGDEHTFGRALDHRMVRAAVSEWQLVRPMV